MNIFVIDKDPTIAAQSLCDKHVVKMILESAQMLCVVHGPGAPYKAAFHKHPCTIWAGKSEQNHKWLCEHAKAMCIEYTKRYGKIHKSETVIDFLMLNKPVLPNLGLTPFAQAMPEQYKNADPVSAYRSYYLGEKRHFAKWKNSDVPLWYSTAISTIPPSV